MKLGKFCWFIKKNLRIYLGSRNGPWIFLLAGVLGFGLVSYHDSRGFISQDLLVEFFQLNQDPVSFAYYDSRFNNVALLTFTDVSTNLVKGFCHCLDRNFQLTDNLHPTKHTKNSFHRYYTTTCDCKNRQRTEYVGITQAGREENWVSDNLTNARPVGLGFVQHHSWITRIRKETETESATENDVGICLAPIFGPYPYWLLLLQFVEIHRALGAAKIFAYYLDAPDNGTRAVLYYYSQILKDPFIELIRLPDQGIPCAKSHFCRHDYQIQDCLQRARVSGLRFVAPIDIDELLMPTQPGKSLPEVVASIKNLSAHSYLLRHRWVFRDVPDPSGNVLVSRELSATKTHLLNMAYLPLNRFHQTTRLGPPKHTAKAIVHTFSAQYMGVHYMVRSLEGFREEQLPPDIAYIRHYRNITHWPGYKEVKTFTPINYTDVHGGLLRQVNDRITVILKEVNDACFRRPILFI